jgi:uncharacterized protein
MKFELYKDKMRQYRWRLVAANGETIADCAEGYKTKAKCKAGLVSVKVEAAAAEVVEVTK